MARRVVAALCTVAGCLLLASPARSAPYDAHTVIVKYSSGLSSSTKSKIGSRAGVLSRVGGITGTSAQVVRVSGDPAAVAARLNRASGVAYAEPNYILRTTAIPNDPRFGELYGLNNTGQSGGLADADIDAPEGWDAAGLGAFPSSGGARVGIVDTGILQTHEDL